MVFIIHKGGYHLAFYKTTQIARMIGVHPNTIRFYEQMQLLPPIPRESNGYRIFNDYHLLQLRFLRTAFRAEIISNKLRQEVFEIVKISATNEIDAALKATKMYSKHLEEEKTKAEEAIHIVLNMLENSNEVTNPIAYHKRAEVARILGITIDVLRDWERNGLLVVPRMENGYRVYGYKEMNRLKIIRTLRNAHYSRMSILRMLKKMDQGNRNIREVIDTPSEEEDIVCAADRYITALSMAQEDVLEMIEILGEMRGLNED